jgi:hydroxymethylpyrimidine pyrophosphatase-like HAD family hydrolase
MQDVWNFLNSAFCILHCVTGMTFASNGRAPLTLCAKQPRMHYLALASDYDGTLAHDSHVSKLTLAAIHRLKDSGRKFILVTGREMPELQSVFPDYKLCDAIVAENGALIVFPAEGREEVLGEPPPEAFLTEMIHRNVKPFSVGKVIFATWRPHETAVLEVIQSLGLEYQIIFNKRAVMVLPSGTNKATGLAKALKRLKIPPTAVVGVGDAENDHAFLESCAVAAAVENALPSLKERCDLVMSTDHGAGVTELIDRLLADDLASLGTRRPRKEIVKQMVKRPAELPAEVLEQVPEQRQPKSPPLAASAADQP